MSFRTQPTVTVAGTYRIKLNNSEKYWKYISDKISYIQLSQDPLDKNNDLFKVYYRCNISDCLLIEISQWNLAPASGDSVFTIRPASNPTVGFTKNVDDPNKYGGCGFAQGYVGPSANWKFRTTTDKKASKYGFSESALVT